MNGEPIQPVRTPLVGPEVQQTRPVPNEERKDRRRNRKVLRPAPAPRPEPEAADLPAEEPDDAEGEHKIDVYT